MLKTIKENIETAVEIAEKLKITKLFSSNDLSYILLSIVVICGAIVLSLVFRKIYSLISRKLVK